MNKNIQPPGLCVWLGKGAGMERTFMLIEKILKCGYVRWLTEPFKRQERARNGLFTYKTTQILALTVVMQIVLYSCGERAGELIPELFRLVSITATCKASRFLLKFLMKARHGL